MTTQRSGAPANIEAERAALGSFLKDPGLVALHGETLEPEDFYLENHGHVLDAMKQVLEDGLLLDVVTVSEQLNKAGHLDMIGGPVFLTDLVDDVGTTAGIEHYVKIIRDKSLIRKMISAATEIASAGYAPDVDPVQFLDDAEKSVFTVLTGGAGVQVRKIDDILATTLEQIQAQLGRDAEITGISTGFDQVDELLLGLHGTDLIILAARPGMGKTAFALNVASHIALNERKAVVLFSLEMGAEQLAMRLLSAEGHVNLKDLRGGKPSNEDFRRLTDAMGRLADADLYIDDTPYQSIADIRSRARRLALQDQCDLVVIDYLQLMRARSNQVPREQQISEISRGLKALAMELKVPVIALSQLNRSLESRQDKRPILSDLRESGAIEQDADIIIFVYRDDYYHPDSDDKGIAEIIVGKQRNGPTGTAKLAFIGQYTKFGNLSPHANF